MKSISAYHYCLFALPASANSVPAGLSYTVNPTPEEVEGGSMHVKARYGVLVSERKLTTEEVIDFNLARIIYEEDEELSDFLAEKAANGYMTANPGAFATMRKISWEAFEFEVYRSINSVELGIFAMNDPAYFALRVEKKLIALADLKHRN